MFLSGITVGIGMPPMMMLAAAAGRDMLRTEYIFQIDESPFAPYALVIFGLAFHCPLATIYCIL